MSEQDLSFVRALPKAELHIHIEGSLEPELMFELAERNTVDLPFDDVDEVRAAYSFSDLQSFLDIYYRGAAVLRTEQDFHDLMAAYLRRASADGVRRAEIFFDPQTHTERGVGFDVFMPGFTRAMADADARSGVSSALIMCFLRHLSPAEAMATFDQATDHLDDIIGIGLDSSEMGHPPEPFEPVFSRARERGLHRVAHAGEEGPPSYIVGALDVLGVERVDHGVRAGEDDGLLERLAREQIPLTVCPLSNLELGVVDRLADHNLKRLLDRGLAVTVNSDDPAYFGGYLLANFAAIMEVLPLTRSDLAKLARNSLVASFATPDQKAEWLIELESVATGEPI